MVSNMDRTFHIWNKNKQEWVKAVWNNDCTNKTPASWAHNPNQTPLKYTYGGNDLWVYTRVIGLELRWWREDPDWWKNHGFLIPPSKPYTENPGFWAVHNNNHFRWMVYDEYNGKYKAYEENGLLASEGDLKTIARINDYVYEPQEEVKEAQVTTTKELQDKLIDYCASKTGRTKHLKALVKIGVLNTDQTYEECVEKITDYLNNEPSVCTEGANKAIKALGLVPETRWVNKEIDVNKILTLLRSGTKVAFQADHIDANDTTPYRIPDLSDNGNNTDINIYSGMPDDKKNILLGQTLYYCLGGTFKLRVWVEEEV